MADTTPKNYRFSNTALEILEAITAKTGETATKTLENLLAMGGVAYGVKVEASQRLLYENLLGLAATMLVHKPHPAAKVARPVKRKPAAKIAA